MYIIMHETYYESAVCRHVVDSETGIRKTVQYYLPTGRDGGHK